MTRGGEAYLGVVLNALHRLLLCLTRTSTELSLQALLRLLLDLPSEAAIVVLLRLCAHVQGSIILLHRHQGLRLAHVGSDELGVTGGSLVTVLHRLGECHELDEGSCAVGKTTSIIGGPSRHL